MILTAGPSITSKEIDYVNDAVTNGWNENWNSYIVRLENAFREKFSVKHALLTSSCTGAMHMGLRALGIEPDDEVIVPELTWVATASVVKYLGAQPIFVDVDPHTWTIDPKSFEEAITQKTKAVMPVHLYGHPAKMDEVMSIAKKYDLLVLEDAAPAVGATFDGKFCGTFGDVAAFSFQGAKMMVSGEGGILITDDDEVFENVKQFSEHGRSKDPNKTFWIEELGYKYKMSNIQAALALAQFERIEDLISRKREIFCWYEDRLKGFDPLTLNKEAEWANSIYWMTSVKINDHIAISRNDLASGMKKKGVDTRPVFPSISQYPMWKSDCKNPIATNIGETALNLPSGHNLTKDQVNYVCDTLMSLLEV
jgi:perosamine synthetase